MSEGQITAFWGAGKYGRLFLKLWREDGHEPSYFIDNSMALVGTEVDGIRVLAPNMIRQWDVEHIYITTSSARVVREQLIEDGFPDDHITTVDSTGIMAFWKEYPKNVNIQNNGQRILFELTAGFVLGGVESWCVDTCRLLNSMGYDSFVMSFDDAPIQVDVRDIMYSHYDITDLTPIMHCVEESLPSVLVSNFPNLITLFSAFRKGYGDNIKHVCIVHSDDELYYKSILQVENYIDICIYISTHIKNKIVSKGFPVSKLIPMKWYIPCERDLNRNYSKYGDLIRVGYAGRIEAYSKRVDLLVEVADMLKKKGIKIILDLVGTGEYENDLKEIISKKDLQDNIHVIGQISREDIPKFWKNHDIAISCSEWEGHSISMCEAMAGGAVPVMTDVSGAKDDIQDGINGFIVPIGDVVKMCERIAYLVNNRDRLQELGARAHQWIYENYRLEQVKAFWNEILEKC